MLGAGVLSCRRSESPRSDGEYMALVHIAIVANAG